MKECVNIFYHSCLVGVSRDRNLEGCDFFFLDDRKQGAGGGKCKEVEVCTGRE